MYTKNINKINNKQLKQTYGEFSFDLKPNVIFLPLFFSEQISGLCEKEFNKFKKPLRCLLMASKFIQTLIFHIKTNTSTKQ